MPPDAEERFPPSSRPARILREMADRIDRNDEDEFAGCIVIIPPENDQGQEPGEIIEVLLIDPARNAANFWWMAKTKAQGGADQWEAANQPGVGYR